MITNQHQNMEGRVSSDQDLKLGDTFRYYQRDSHAAKALLVRRLRCLAAYETANRNLERARSKNNYVHAVSYTQQFYVLSLLYISFYE